MGIAIVVLAAGLGTRYGGLKQLAPLGPAGEAIVDYTLHDAAAAGFSEAVIVVTPAIGDAIRSHFREFSPAIPVRLAQQDAAVSRQTASQRTTPWGTAHAALAGADGLTVPFAVANADDAYGTDAIATMAEFLRARVANAGERFHTAAVVGYPAGATLSPRGGVSRAVCRVDEHGTLIAIAEHTGVARVDGRLVSDTPPTSVAPALDETTLVSMNLWGFLPSFLETLRPHVDRFVEQHRDDDRELRLPDLVGELIAAGEIAVTVLPTTSRWLGVTYPDDAPAVREQLAELTHTGAYPSFGGHEAPAR